MALAALAVALPRKVGALTNYSCGSNLQVEIKKIVESATTATVILGNAAACLELWKALADDSNSSPDLYQSFVAKVGEFTSSVASKGTEIQIRIEEARLANNSLTHGRPLAPRRASRCVWSRAPTPNTAKACNSS